MGDGSQYSPEDEAAAFSFGSSLNSEIKQPSLAPVATVVAPVQSTPEPPQEELIIGEKFSDPEGIVPNNTQVRADVTTESASTVIPEEIIAKVGERSTVVPTEPQKLVETPSTIAGVPKEDLIRYQQDGAKGLTEQELGALSPVEMAKIEEARKTGKYGDLLFEEVVDDAGKHWFFIKSDPQARPIWFVPSNKRDINLEGIRDLDKVKQPQEVDGQRSGTGNVENLDPKMQNMISEAEKNSTLGVIGTLNEVGKGELEIIREKDENGQIAYYTRNKQTGERAGIVPGADFKAEGAKLEIPAGLAEAQIWRRVRDLTRQREKEGKDQDKFITDLEETLAPYAQSANALERDMVLKIMLEARTRMTMSKQMGSLAAADYKAFGSDMPLDENLRYMWNDFTDHDKLRDLVGLMEAGIVGGDPGQYWRESPDPATGAYPPGSFRQQVEDQLIIWFPDPPPPATLEQTVEVKDNRDTLKNLAETMLAVTGMESVYRGAVDANGRLIDFKVMGVVDGTVGVPPLGTRQRYFLNEQYYILWRQEREAAFKARQSGALTTVYAVDNLGRQTDATALRRIEYCSEETQKNNIGLAESLRPQLETYFRSLPQQYGFRSLTDLMGGINAGLSTDIFEWGRLATGAGEVVPKMFELLNQPLAGNDPAKLDTSLKPLSAVEEGFTGYLRKTPSLQYFAVADSVASVVNYINGNSRDRRRDLGRKIPFKIGLDTRNAMVSAFETLLDEQYRERALRAVNAADHQVLTKSFRTGTWSWLSTTLKAFFGQVAKK